MLFNKKNKKKKIKKICFQIALLWCAFPDGGGVTQLNPYDSCDLAPCEVGYFLTAGGGASYLI